MVDPLEPDEARRRRFTRRDLMGTIAVTGAAMLVPAWAATTGGGMTTRAQASAQRRGVVAAGSQSAADAGAEMLSIGGNAADAAIAAALAMTVADPANTSLVGRTHIVAVDRNGRGSAIDGRSTVPASWKGGTPAEGAAVVPVGGNPRSFEHALARFGRLELEQVCAPAIALAERGFIVRSNLARAWAQQADILSRDPTARRLFLKPDGSSPRYGERFKQPELAATLGLYAAGGTDALLDAAANRDAQLLRDQGSVITSDDFRAYRPVDAEHLDFRYRGWRVWSIGRQGYGYLLAETLGILEHFDLARMDDADRWATMLLAQRLAFRDRETALGNQPQSIRAADHVRKQADALKHALLSGGVTPLFGKLTKRPSGQHDTTHLSVVDGDGMAVSITQSIGPHFGARVASAGGYLFAHSYQMESGRKVSHADTTAQLPTILEAPDGTRVALGAAGSDRIPGAVIRTIIHTVDVKMRPQRAVAEPACVIHDGHVQASAEIEPAVLDRLTALGFPVRKVTRVEGEHFGLIHVARRDANGRLSAAADTYWDGGTAQS